jgi:hypothetical protein
MSEVLVPVQTTEQFVQKEKEPIKGKAFFYSGILGTDKGLYGIKDALSSVYGKENLKAYNSVVSFDTPHEKRFDKMADDLVEAFNSGENIYVTAHSMGQTEFTEAFKRAEKKLRREHPDWYRDNQKGAQEHIFKKLYLTAISPAGFFQGPVGSLKFIKRAGELTVAGTLPGLDRLPNNHRAIDMLQMFPLDVDQTVLAQAMRKAFPEMSQYTDGALEIPNNPTTNYTPLLSEKQRPILEKNNSQIKKGLAKGLATDNWSSFRKAVRRRSNLLPGILGKAYEDPSVGKQETEKQQKASLGLYAQAIPDALSIGINILRGKSYKLLERLYRRGVALRFLVPENDLVVYRPEILDFFKNEDPADVAKAVSILTLDNHQSFAIQANPKLKDAIEQTEYIRKKPRVQHS